MDQREKSEIIRKFARSEQDVGSVEVQVAVLSKRISELTEHMKVHRHDHSTRRGLLNLVNRRRRLLTYLKRKSVDRYAKLIDALSLRR